MSGERPRDGGYLVLPERDADPGGSVQEIGEGQPDQARIQLRLACLPTPVEETRGNFTDGADTLQFVDNFLWEVGQRRRQSRDRADTP